MMRLASSLRLCKYKALKDCAGVLPFGRKITSKKYEGIILMLRTFCIFILFTLLLELDKCENYTVFHLLFLIFLIMYFFKKISPQ